MPALPGGGVPLKTNGPSGSSLLLATTSTGTVWPVLASTASTLGLTGIAESAVIEMPRYTTSTATSTKLIARGTSRSGLAASSDMLETVSMPVYAMVPIEMP